MYVPSQYCCKIIYCNMNVLHGVLMYCTINLQIITEQFVLKS